MPATAQVPVSVGRVRFRGRAATAMRGDSMRCRRVALLGVVVAVSVGLTACGGGGKSTATTPAATSGTASGAASPVVAKRGVVTVTMATVGDPGNPSVGVIQSFGGPKGMFVDPPKPPKDTGIYANCSDAPK